MRSTLTQQSKLFKIHFNFIQRLTKEIWQLLITSYTFSVTTYKYFSQGTTASSITENVRDRQKSKKAFTEHSFHYGQIHGTRGA